MDQLDLMENREKLVIPVYKEKTVRQDKEAAKVKLDLLDHKVLLAQTVQKGNKVSEGKME
jgi:hypothetical protein